MKAIEIDDIRESPLCLRQSFSGIEDLAASIERHGLLVPPLLRRVRSGHEVVLGARRIRALRLNGAKYTQAVVRELTDAEVIEVQLSDSAHGEALSPFDEAAGFQRLMDDFRYTADRIAERVGKSKSWVYSRLRLLKLSRKERARLSAAPVSVAVMAAETDVETREALVVAASAAPGASVRDLRAAARGDQACSSYEQGQIEMRRSISLPSILTLMRPS